MPTLTRRLKIGDKVLPQKPDQPHATLSWVQQMDAFIGKPYSITDIKPSEYSIGLIIYELEGVLDIGLRPFMFLEPWLIPVLTK